MPAANSRPKWVSKNDADISFTKDQSILSSSSRKAPRIKSPFPDEIGKPSPIKSKPDILDELLGKKS